jgi:glyoxalase superfamily protein
MMHFGQTVWTQTPGYDGIVGDLQKPPAEQSVVRVGSVVVDCGDFHKMLAFWQEALRYVPVRPPTDDWVILRDPAGRNVSVSLQKLPERQLGKGRSRIGKNRLHFDLYTTDQQGEVQRLLRIGATRHPRTSKPDEDFIMLADPEGNLFCVVDTSK